MIQNALVGRHKNTFRHKHKPSTNQLVTNQTTAMGNNQSTTDRPAKRRRVMVDEEVYKSVSDCIELWARRSFHMKVQTVETVENLGVLAVAQKVLGLTAETEAAKPIIVPCEWHTWLHPASLQKYFSSDFRTVGESTYFNTAERVVGLLLYVSNSIISEDVAALKKVDKTRYELSTNTVRRTVLKNMAIMAVHRYTWGLRTNWAKGNIQTFRDLERSSVNGNSYTYTNTVLPMIEVIRHFVLPGLEITLEEMVDVHFHLSFRYFKNQCKNGLYSEEGLATNTPTASDKKCMNGLMYPHFIAARALYGEELLDACVNMDKLWITNAQKMYNNHEITQWFESKKPN